MIAPQLRILVAVSGFLAVGFVRTNHVTAQDAVPSQPDGVGQVSRSDPGDAVRSLQLNFRKAPWEKVLQWLADQSGLAFSTDVIPSGTFTYVDRDRRFTPDQAIDLVNSYLLIKGYALLRHDRMLLTVDLEEEIDRRLVADLVTEIPLGKLDARGRYEITKMRFTLKRADATVAEKQISPMLSPVGSLIVMPEAKQIVATDTAGNLRAIRDILVSLENEADLNYGRLRTFRMRTATADEVLAIARPLLDIPEDKNASEDGSVKISADPLGRMVYATGIPEKMELVEQIVKAVDGDAASSVGQSPVERSFLASHPVHGTESAAVLRVLQTLFVGDPVIRLEVDTSSGAILAFARKEQHELIGETIGKMEQMPTGLEVIPLRVTDPTAVVLLVEKMFGGAASPPIVDGTLEPRQLVIRGTPTQVTQIRQLLMRMGEQFATISGGRSKGNVRILSMDPNSVADVVNRLRQIWPQLRSNELRVLQPEQDPMLRTIRPRPESDKPNAGDERDLDLQRPESNDEAFRSVPNMRTQDLPATIGLTRTRLVQFVEVQAQGEQVADQVDQVDSGQANAAKNVVVTPTPGGLMIASEDQEALDTLERLLDAFQTGARSGPRFHLFYLKHIEAEAAMELLNGILGGMATDALVSSTVGGSSSPSSSSRGGSSSSTTSSGGSGQPHMVADKRLNALFIQGTKSQIAMIDQLLGVIDTEGGPEEVLTFPKPRFIPVAHADAEEVAEVVKELYANRIETGNNNSRNQQSPGSFFSRFRGGAQFGGRGRDSEQSNNRDASAGELPKMTIAVDAGSNSVVVSAPGPLLKEVEAVIHEIDERASTQPPETFAVVTLKKTRPDAVQAVLAGILGENVQTSSSRSTSGRSARERPANPFEMFRAMRGDPGSSSSRGSRASSRGERGDPGGTRSGATRSGVDRRRGGGSSGRGGGGR